MYGMCEQKTEVKIDIIDVAEEIKILMYGEQALVDRIASAIQMDRSLCFRITMPDGRRRVLPPYSTVDHVNRAIKEMESVQ